MPIETIEFNGELYPKFQSEGFASKFAIPFAQQVCSGHGLDIGCGEKEWAFPGAFCVDLKMPPYHATHLPPRYLSDEKIESDGLNDLQWDYIFSSHLLEHLDKWVDVLDYWFSMIRRGGIVFLYLPDFSQKYWRPWNNRKHVSAFTPEIIKAYLETKSKKVFISGIDLNNSFIAIAEK